MTNEITMTLVEDISKVIASVARDYIPAKHMEITIETSPPAAVLRIPGEPNDDVSCSLNRLRDSLKATVEKAIPSQPFRFMVITGTEASGLKVIALPASEPLYGHVHKAKLAWLRRPERVNI